MTIRHKRKYTRRPKAPLPKRRHRRNPGLPPTNRMDLRERLERRKHVLRRVRRSIRNGHSLLTISKTVGVSRAVLAEWLWEMPLLELQVAALGPDPKLARQPLARDVGEKFDPIKRPRAPLARHTLTKHLLENPPKPGSPDWLTVLERRALQGRAKVAYARLASDFGSLSEGQKLLITQAAHIEVILERTLDRIDRLLDYEVAGVRGAVEALYDWEWAYVAMANKLRAVLNEAGLPKRLPGAPRKLGRAGRVVINDE